MRTRWPNLGVWLLFVKALVLLPVIVGVQMFTKALYLVEDICEWLDYRLVQILDHLIQD